MASSTLRSRLARLDRLLAEKVSQGGGGKEDLFVSVAIAIAVGGYPMHSPHPWKANADSYGDAFARALGYADSAEHRAAIEADDPSYEPRARQAIAALCGTDDLGAEALSDSCVLRACASTFAAAPAGIVPERIGADLVAAAKARGIALS